MRPATSCVVSQRLELAFGAHPSGVDQTATFLSPVSLRATSGGRTGLFYDLKYVFAVVESSAVATQRGVQAEVRMYQYRLLDYDQRELLVYHWQPGQRFAGPDEPHVHVSATLDAKVDAINRRDIALDKRHLVTGRVSLPAVVRMLITELGVAPLRPAWGTILDRAETAIRDLE